MKNVFVEEEQKLTLGQYMEFDPGKRGNLGDMVPLQIYRLLEYSMREVLREEYGKEEQIRIFRKAGYQAGKFFVEHFIDTTLNLDGFIAQVQEKIEALKIGVLRIESVDDQTGQIILSVSEDADCSGLPLLGETVCNYDEGFLSGIMSTYTGKAYHAVEVDCWATGERVCRFCVNKEE